MPVTLPRQGFQPYESAYCCLNKVAWLNRMDGRTLRGLLAQPAKADAKADWTKEGVDLNTEVGLSVAALEQLLQTGPESNAGRFTSFYDYFITSGGDLTQRQYAPFLRYCPKCIEVGFHTALTQLRQVKACPIHGIELLEACPTCGEPVLYCLTTANISRPFACKNGHPIWHHIRDAIHRVPNDPEYSKPIENYLAFRDELARTADMHAWGLSLQTRSENRLEAPFSPPSPAYWSHYTSARPPVGMFAPVPKTYQRFEHQFDKVADTTPEPPTGSKAAKRKAALALLANIDPYAPLLQSVSAATARSILRRACAEHRQCLRMSHEAVKDLMDRRRMPCTFTETFVVWMRLLGAPSIWARTNERGCRELWPHRMDRNPPQFSILQNINLGLAKMHPFIEEHCKRRGIAGAARLTADWAARVWSRQILLSAFVRCDELLHGKSNSKMDVEHLNLLTPDMLVPYVHLSIDKGTRKKVHLVLDVWEPELETRLARAVAVSNNHKAVVNRVFEKWLHFSRMGLINVKQGPRTPLNH